MSATVPGTVLFDGSILGAGPITGVAGSFLTTLRAYGAASRHESVLLLPKDAPAERFEMPGVRTFACLSTGRWRRLKALQRACIRFDARLLHSPVAAVPVRGHCKIVATVHDVPWLYPELRRERGSRLGPRLALGLALRRAAAVVVPSRATLTDVARCARADLRRVRVIHHGVRAPDHPADATELTGPFLVLGDNRPRKNLRRVREAHALARERVPDLPGLRFVGPPDDYVDDDEKWHILRRSRALLHLSLLEGFGLPVLEAFAHGVPVVCSDRHSLPEVAGGAALQADPDDTSAMADAIVRIHQDHELRDELRRRGLARAATLTPEKTAREWLRLHEELRS